MIMMWERVEDRLCRTNLPIKINNEDFGHKYLKCIPTTEVNEMYGHLEEMVPIKLQYLIMLKLE